MKAKVYYKFFLTLPEKEITHKPEKSKEQLKKLLHQCICYKFKLANIELSLMFFILCDNLKTLFF